MKWYLIQSKIFLAMAMLSSHTLMIPLVNMVQGSCSHLPHSRLTLTTTGGTIGSLATFSIHYVAIVDSPINSHLYFCTGNSWAVFCSLPCWTNQLQSLQFC